MKELQMKLSDRTITILKNFATINDSLLFLPGKIQKTVNESDYIQCEAVLEEDFPTEFGIYDLRTFLSNVAALKDPDISFSSSYLTLSDGTFTIDYFYTSPRNIKSPEAGGIEVGEPDVKFTLTNQEFQRLVKLADMNGLPSLKITGKNGEIIMQARENTDSSNSVLMKIDTYEGEDFDVTFTLENLKLLPDDYEVSLYIDGLGVFENTSKTLKYFITLDN